MAPAKPTWHKNLDRAANEFGFAITKQFCSMGVDTQNGAIRVSEKDRVRVLRVRETSVEEGILTRV